MESAWRKAHWEEYKKSAGLWIAYDPEGDIIASDKGIVQLTQFIDCTFDKKSGKKVIYHFVHPSYVLENYPARFLGIYFKAIRSNLWRPTKNIEIISEEKSGEFEFLVDSGADFSLIGYQSGLSLGFERAKNEKVYTGEAAGGAEISYLLRDVKMNIDGHTFSVTVAWLLDENSDELLLGREIVFDFFDIEFKQADEQILFKWRGEQV